MSKFKYNLESILSELSEYHGNRDELLKVHIQNRLNKSLETYYKELTKTFLYLDYRNEENLINKYERIMQ